MERVVKMEPLSQELRQLLLDTNRAKPDEIDEFERLLCERFFTDPDEESVDGERRELRLAELFKQFFPDGYGL